MTEDERNKKMHDMIEALIKSRRDEKTRNHEIFDSIEQHHSPFMRAAAESAVESMTAATELITLLGVLLPFEVKDYITTLIAKISGSPTALAYSFAALVSRPGRSVENAKSEVQVVQKMVMQMLRDVASQREKEATTAAQALGDLLKGKDA